MSCFWLHLELPEIAVILNRTENSTEVDNSSNSDDLSELEQENQLLKNEIVSLNQEIRLHAQRLQSTNQGELMTRSPQIGGSFDWNILPVGCIETRVGISMSLVSPLTTESTESCASFESTTHTQGQATTLYYTFT